MAKSVADRGRGARMARRDEGAYSFYVTEEQRSQPGCIGREGDRLSHSRALRASNAKVDRAWVGGHEDRHWAAQPSALRTTSLMGENRQGRQDRQVAVRRDS